MGKHQEKITNKFDEMITHQRIILAILMGNIHKEKHEKTMSKIIDHEFLQDKMKHEE